MRLTAPIPALSASAPPMDGPQPPALPVMRGQVFEAVTDASGQLAEPLPLPPGVRLRVTVVGS
jgi:hypothetical protein